MVQNVRRGFTLIELLVVIAIIAILASILFPVFAQAREKARQATCASNLKQVGTSMNMYVQDYDEVFPINDGASNTPAYYTQPYNARAFTAASQNSRSSVPATTLQPYLKNWKVYECPSTSINAAFLTAALAAGQQEYKISYAYNGQLANSTAAVINAPSSCILFWEPGKYSIRNYFIATPTLAQTVVPHPTYGGTATCALYVPAIPVPSVFVHGQGANYLYVDGHVRWVSALGGDANKQPWSSVNASTGVPGGYWAGARGCAWLFRPEVQ